VATGEVHHDLSVARIDGLAVKLGCLIEFLTHKRPACRLIVAWPKSNHVDVDDTTRRKLDELGTKVMELDTLWPLLKDSVAEARSRDPVRRGQLDELEAKISERLKQVYGEWAVVLAAVADFLHVTVKVARLLLLGLVVGVGAVGLLVLKSKFLLVPVAAYLACNYTSLDNVCEYFVTWDGHTKCKTGEIYNSSLQKCIAPKPPDGGTKFGQAPSVCTGGEIYDYISKNCFAPTAFICPIGEIRDYFSNKCVLPRIIEAKPAPAPQ
jgi:hypothetical protein